MSNGSIRVGEEQLRAAIITKDSNGGILIPEMKTTLRCISILSEIPEDLRDEYTARVKKDETLVERTDKNVSREPEIRIFAYTFVSDQSDAIGRRGLCETPVERRSNIRFVPTDVNNILGLYVRALRINSSEMSKTSEDLELQPDHTVSVNLCQDIKCAYGEDASMLSFNIENEADLTYARSFTDTMLGINTSNDIRRLHNNDDSDFYFTDLEINKFLRLSYDMAFN